MSTTQFDKFVKEEYDKLNKWLDKCPIGYAQVDYEDDDIISIVVPQIKEVN